MTGFCDLHTHSVFSDGTLTPEELVSMAENLCLDAIALCDHNTVAGLPAFLAAAADKRVEAIAGVEFSTDYSGMELHILGLLLKPEHFRTVTALLAESRRRKEQSNRDLVAALVKDGYSLDYGQICSAAPNAQINRAHIATALLKAGYVSSVTEAFQTLLSPTGKYYMPPVRHTAFEIIEFIKSLGAVAVLAHPFLSLEESVLRIFLQDAVPHGLDAMETMYSTYDPLTMHIARKTAKEFGLLESGGSDYHGAVKPSIRMGTGEGNLRVPTEFLHKLQAL